MKASRDSEGELRARAPLQALSQFQVITTADGSASEETLRALLREAMSSVGALAGGIFMVDEAGSQLELKTHVQYPAALADRYRLIPLSARLPLVDAVKGATAVFIESLDDYAARYPEFAAAHPDIATKAFAALPLTADGRCAGAIALGFGAPRSFTPEERGYLAVVADQCSNAIERARRLQAEQASRLLAEHASQRLERLHAFTGALAQASTPAEVVETVLQSGILATSARTSNLWMRTPDQASVVLFRSVGPDDAALGDGASISIEAETRLPVLDAMRDGVAIWIESANQLEERYSSTYGGIPDSGERSLACLPLLVESRCIGCLTYVFDGVHRFLEDDRAFLQVVAWYSAQALERARLYTAEKEAKEQAERNQRRSDFIAHIGTVLGSSLEDSNVLSDVARATVPGFADWCVVELADQRLSRAQPVANHTDASKIPSVLELRRRVRELPFGFGIDAVMRSGTSLRHPEVRPEMVSSMCAGDPAVIELVADVGIASAVVVPLSARGQVLGVILLCRVDPAQPYAEEDLATAEELGRRVGLAVDNARLYTEARDADRLKDEFLAMLSHELRNPLAPILTALELMNRGGNPAFAEERALITRHARHVARLVEDLLDVASITRDKIQLELEPCELTSIIANAVEMARPLIEQRRQRLISTPEPGLRVIGDRARLTQAIANLLTNAAKYTEPGGVISVGAKMDGSEAMVRVRDSGVGIAPELLPRIFDLFVQGARELDRSKGGLGIGLTVVQSIARLHGGTVSAQSAGVGQGSEFVMRLPRAETAVDAPPVATPAPASSGAIGERLRVLVVDDNEDAADLLGRVLESLGCSARVVHDGDSALASARDFDPELVLLDIGLPGQDGYEVARRLRQSALGAAAKIIAITGYGRASDRQRSVEAGFDGHVVKPMRLETLEQIVADYRTYRRSRGH